MPSLLILPAQTQPPDESLVRRHTPKPIGGDYVVFRRCLRWEFGFTCAICLLHERDIISYGVEEWGVTQIEHMVARSEDKSLTGVYGNLLYICRLCNGARNDTDRVDHLGRRLLDPTVDVWAHHFHLVGDTIIPVTGDRHADYTADVYEMNDARKVRLRKKRRVDTEDLLNLIQARSEDQRRYEARRLRGDPAAKADAEHDLTRAGEDLERYYRRLPAYVWLPDDKPEDCRCKRVAARTLPAVYRRQCVKIDVP